MKTIIDELGFRVLLTTITKEADEMANNIHAAGMYALKQVNCDGNYNFASLLIDALGKKHDKKRVIAWLTFYGKLSNTKDKGLVYRKRKDIVSENVEAWLTRADKTPYWEHTPQEEGSFSVDYLSMLISIFNKHNRAEELKGTGKAVKETHIGVLEEIKAIIKRHQNEINENVYSRIVSPILEDEVTEEIVLN